MRMLFRVEASDTIGRGHLSRMLALAQMLESDFPAEFVVSEQNKEYCSSLLQGRQVHYLRHEDDLLDFITKRDFLWVDGYAFDNEWRSRFRPHVFKLIYIDDLTGDIQGADAVINHCPGVTVDQYVKYSGTEYFLGLDFAMLRHSFLQRARDYVSEERSQKGVFVCFGGADPKGLGRSFVKAILDAGFKEPVYFVTSDASVRDLASNHCLKVLTNLSEDEMIYYMDTSAVAVVPASVLSFEAIALRKPLLTMYYVDNQRLIYQGISALRLGVGTGYAADATNLLHIHMAFAQLYENKDIQREIISNQCFSLNGYSADRFRLIIENWLSEGSQI